MKKIIMIGVIVAVSILGIIFLRNRFEMPTFMRSGQSYGDLVIVNDSPNVISVEYQENGRNVSPVLQPGDTATGGQGIIRVFTADKTGSYEIKYAYPRSATAPQQITLSQIVGAAKNEKLSPDIFVKRGMIGDVSIEYEEPREVDSMQY